MKFAVKVLTSIAAITAFNPLWAATFTYQAITDFTDINAGEVPFHVDGARNALAINAAVVNFRDKFARATVEFEENSGLYDVTITALGEIDGDGEYRFLINGEVVGTAINTPTDDDFGEQLHTFENISIPQGALIGVESITSSNGLIPEGDGYAFARGRWRALTIADVEDDAATPDPVENVDLSLEVLTDNNTTTTGEEISIEITVENLSDDIATNPTIDVTFSEGVGNLASDTCVESDADTMTCSLMELVGNDTTSFTITASALNAGETQITAVVSADQSDLDASNNSDSINIEIQSVVIPSDDTVDLELSISANKERIEVGDTVDYTVTVTNLHESNTATSPTAGLTFPASMQFEAGNTCTGNELSVICEIEELPPGASALVTISATAVGVNNNTTILATASSAQAESIVANNESQIVTVVNPKTLENVVTPADQQTGNSSTPVTTSTTATSDTATTSSGGGGALQFPIGLLLIAVSVLYSRRR